MPDADPKQIEQAISEGWQMRVGGKLARTLYVVPPDNWTDDTCTAVKDRYADLCVGIVDNANLAHRIVTLWNQGKGRGGEDSPAKSADGFYYVAGGYPGHVGGTDDPAGKVRSRSWWRPWKRPRSHWDRLG